MRAKPIDSFGAISAASASYNDYRFHTFRIWYGMAASAWLSLLVRNRFAVSPERFAFTMLGFATWALNSIFYLIQTLIFATRIRTCVIEHPRSSILATGEPGREISPGQRAEVYRRRNWYMHRFGYQTASPT